MEAVKENGFALRFASERLKDDKEIVLEAVKENENSFQFVSARLKHD